MPTLSSQIATLDDFEAEYRLATHMVVFSHGFGVMRDARGMFTEIAANLPEGFGYVLFDYNRPEGDKLRLTNLSDQVTRLTSVIAWVRQQPGVEHVTIISHSKGCIVTALAKPQEIAAVIMLAPPLQPGSGTREYFTTRPGTVKQGSTWIVPRSDGTTSLIDEAVFAEMDTLDGEQVVLSYAQTQPLYIIAAGDDRVLPDQDYAKVAACPGTAFDSLPGASHDFQGAARQPLIWTVNTYLRTHL